MKCTPLLELSFIFFAFITEQLSATNTPVLDFTGENVLTGTEYNILTTSQESARTCSGLSLFNGESKTCPLNVIQEQLEFLKGTALTFSHAHDHEGVVYESLRLNIKFSTTECICGQSTVWRIGNFDDSTGQWFITGGGIEGNPGAQTMQSWFKIEKASTHAYKISHCPSVRNSCVSLYGDVGIYSGGGVRRLALSHTPLSVIFVKGKQ
ncbi:hypothetical protein Pint_16623 [Pistacia integerrima]|uniref:Uncharacterized protein n=1 Tax=Pistacia integerrima TaxID=434235 RepID=A0ACC0ZG24_9ROSI|nr:hypothetical protein Pint_16623 [Pistacia integerrima]